ncbi:MAG TPA: hypothetical protein VGB52_13175 [Actinomycetota bacterium]
MPRTMVALIVALLATASIPASAAVEHVVAVPGSGAPNAGEYATPVVVSRAGTEVAFDNLDPATSPHDVVSDLFGPDGRPWCQGVPSGGCRLFASQTVAGPATVPVRGTELLAAGSYGFFCRVHPWMTGTLVVA